MAGNGTSYNLTLVARTEGDVTRLTNQLNGVTAAAGRTQAALGTMNTQAVGWAAGLRGLAGSFGVLWTGAAAGRFILDATQQFQQFDNAVKSFTGSTAVAGQAFKDVQEIAAKGFDITPLLQAESTFLSLGNSLEQSKEFITAIAQIGSTVDSAALGRISLAFTQIAAKGKVSLEEIRQLGEAGVPALKLFADAAGVSVSEFQKLASQGKIFSGDVLPKVMEAVDKLYGPAYAARQDTIFGAFATAQVDATNLARAWGEELTPAIMAMTRAFTAMLGVIKVIPPQMFLLGAAIYKMGPAIAGLKGLGSAAKDMFMVWRVGAGPMNAAIAANLAALGKLKAGLIAVAAVAAGAVTAGLFAPEDAANIDQVTASLINLADTQDMASLSAIKYADNFGEMMNVVNNPSWLKRSEDFVAAIGGIIGIGPGRSKDTFEFLQNLKQIDGTLASMAKSGRAEEAAAAFATLKESVRPEDMEAFMNAMPQYQAALKGLANGAVQTGDAFQELADQQKALQNGWETWAGTITAAGRAFLDATKLVHAYTDARKSASDAIDKSRKVTADEKQSLLALADNALTLVESQAKAGKSVIQVRKTMQDSREDFIKVAEKMGLTAEKAEDLANKVGLIPKNVDIAFKITGLEKLQQLNEQLNGISDYEKATGSRLSSQRMEINAELQTTYELIAKQTIPVAVQNWPGGGNSGSSKTVPGPGRTGPPLGTTRALPVRMVSI